MRAGHTGFVTDLCYVESNKKLFSASNGGEIIVWHYAQTQKTLKFVHVIEVTCLMCP